MTLEDDLRLTLRARAAEPAPQPELLDQVRTGIRRGNRRRAAVLGAGVALAAVIAVPVALAGDGAPRRSTPAGPSPAATSPAPDPAATAGWVRPALDLPTFPLTPDWEPAGVGDGHVGRLGPNVLLSYDTLQVEVGPVPGDWEAEGDGDRTTTVSGRRATVRAIGPDDYQGLRPGDRYVGVRWRLADGRWVQILSSGTLTEDEVLRFARGLRLKTVPAGPSPFAVAAAPPGLILQAMAKGHLCLAPPGAAAERAGRGLCISVDPTTPQDGPLPEDERVTIGGRPAYLSGMPEAPVSLTLTLDGERTMVVHREPSDVELTRDQMILFASGITVR